MIGGEPAQALGYRKLADVEPADVRAPPGLFAEPCSSTSEIRKTRAALSALFATAVEDGLLRFNPIQGARVPAARSTEGALDEHAKALTREELALLRASIPEDWRLFFRLPWLTPACASPRPRASHGSTWTSATAPASRSASRSTEAGAAG